MSATRKRPTRRGVALLMVITAIAMLTAVAVEFSYRARVEARLAANARDQLRAYYLARSAVALGRLVLHFQRQVDSIQIPGSIMGMLGGLMGGGMPGMGGSSTALPTSLASAQSGSLHLRLWDVIPVDSGTLQLFIGPPTDTLDEDFGGKKEPPPPPEPLNNGSKLGTEYKLSGVNRAFGDFEGTFHAEIADEESKINVNALNQLSALAAATSMEMLTLMHWKDRKYDFLFQDDDMHRQIAREEVLNSLHDWIDADQTTSTFNPIALSNFSDPFAAGFGDEDEFYQRQEPRYRAKNALLDTVQELYEVHGITDRFMAAFGKSLTVYSSPSALLNVNTSDPNQQLTNVLVSLDTTRNPEVVQQLLGSPILLQTVLSEIQMLRMFSFLGLSVQSFVAVLTANGLPVNPFLTTPNSPNAFLGDTSQTFTIKATGQVGDVESRITAVIRYDDQLGKLLYWREE
ncbi:MAG TPA: type II secretion system minor pseudopilin GspK [Myxococcales bacterium]|nr:type II secretion system minor pseudopilin GspK [Myxococcales bacterium]